MPEFFSYDPWSGVTRYFDYDETTGTVAITSQKDIEHYLKQTSEARATRRNDKGLMDNGREFHLYAQLDPIVMLELYQKGIDIYSSDKEMQRRMFDEINANYPWCKVTDKTHR